MNSQIPTVFVRDGKVFANSRDVASYFEKNHRDVLRDVDNLLKSLAAQNCAAGLFAEQRAFHEGANRELRSFDMTRDGFTLLAMGFTGQRALAFKLRYIEQFNAMEAELKADRPPTLTEAAQAAARVLSPREVNAWRGYLDTVSRIFDRQIAARQYPKTPLPALAEDAAAFLPPPQGGIQVPELDGMACLAHLLKARVSRTNLTLGDLLRVARGDTITRNSLGDVGVRVDPVNLRGQVAFAVSHPRMQRAFAGTPWAEDWSLALLAVPGARPAPDLLEGFDRKRRAVLVPWETVEDVLAGGAA